MKRKSHWSVRFEKRAAPPWYIRALNPVICILLAFVCCGIIVAAQGFEPLAVYSRMLKNAFGSSFSFLESILQAIPLIFCGLGVSVAFRMSLNNIGAEGQVLMGGLLTALVMVYWGEKLPGPVLYLVMLLTSIAVGAIWGLIPAFFKAKWKTNETLFTLMMNYVATSFVACAVNILRGQASSLGKLNMATQIGWFPKLFGQRYNINILVVLILTFLMFFYLKYTKHGFEISVVGESENTARYAGINVGMVIMRTMAISGAICGLCGFLLVCGRDQTISTNTAGGNGFTAIIVAWLAKFNTFYMALIAFLLIFLQKGAGEIASAYGLNDFAASIITGVILFCILGSEFFINYRLIFRSSKEGKNDGERG